MTAPGRILVGVALLALACEAAVAAPPASALPARSDASARAARSDVAVTRWTTANGLPSNLVHCLLQTRDGFLWIGTAGGLVRFDGVDFESFDPASTPSLTCSRFSAMCEAADGALWVGGVEGGLFRHAREPGRRFESFGGGQIDAIAQDATGRMLIGAREGLFTVVDGKLMPAPEAALLGKQGVHRIAVHRSGSIFVCTDNALFRLDGRIATPMRWADPADASRCSAAALAIDAEGTLWSATGHGLCRTVEGSDLLEPVMAKHTNLVACAKDGTIWVGTADGIELWRDGRCIAASDAGMETGRDQETKFATPVEFRALMVDREGYGWCGSNVGGLARIARTPVRGFRADDGLAGGLVGPLIEDAGGDVLVGTMAGLYRGDGENGFAPVLPPEEIGRFGCVRALHRDADGSILIGAEQRVLRLRDGKYETVARVTDPEFVRSFLTLPDGTLWVGSTWALRRFEGGREARVFRAHDGLPGKNEKSEKEKGIVAVIALERDPRGGIWVGTDAGACRIETDHVEPLVSASGLVPGPIRAILVDDDGRGETLVWFGSYGGGLWLQRAGKLTQFTTEDGLPDNLISSIVSDRADTSTPSSVNLFLNTNRGIVRVSREELLALADDPKRDLTCTVYDVAPGFRTSEAQGTAYRTGLRDSNGRFWFSEMDGVVRLDPAQQAGPAQTDIAAITTIADGRGEWAIDLPSVPGAPIELDSGARNLEFRFTALSLVEPELIRFRYQLEGFDDGPVEAQHRRSAFYSDLPPGSYRFDVQARNADGKWSPPATTAFTIPARFYETLWFRAAEAAVGLFGLLLLLHWRTRAIERRSEKLQQLVDERTAELKAHRDELEQRVKERTSELEEAYARLRADYGERERLHAELAQSQKLESIGRLAGGVAHDFNNLLTVIMGFAEVGEISLDDAETLRGAFAQIQRAGESAAKLTSHLLAFARRQVVNPQALDVGGVVEGIAPMLCRLLGEDVRLSVHMTPDTWPVFADRHGLEQVILNLAVNARDAMPKGGPLAIEARNVVLPLAGLTTDLPRGEYIELRVEDQGVGMDAATLARAFEPFFTTKEPGSGTGLGLSTCYGLVRQIDGDILIESEPGRGTIVRVLLPRSMEAPADAVGPLEGGGDAGCETVLVVEDHVEVRRVTCAMLRRLGYDLIEAADGRHALEIAAARPIDLLLSDVIMPEMTGPELAEQLERIRPGVAVLFMSGYLESVIATRGLVPAGLSVLQKPFRIEQLASALRRTIEARHAPERPRVGMREG